jgi:hypothetical protein
MTTNGTSKKQNTVSLSSSAAEYQALSKCVQESVFTQNLVEELTGKRKPVIIYKDNFGTIFLVKSQQVSSRTKHIDIWHHYMRDLQDRKALDVRFKRSENNSADIMTKNTTREVHEKHTQQIRNGTLPFWKEYVKQDSSVTEFTKSQSLAASITTTSPGDSSVSTALFSPEHQSNRWRRGPAARPPVYSCKIQCKVYRICIVFGMRINWKENQADICRITLE